MQYKVWKLSDYAASGTFKGQEMSMCTRGAGKVLIRTARGTSSKPKLIYV